MIAPGMMLPLPIPLIMAMKLTIPVRNNLIKKPIINVFWNNRMLSTDSQIYGILPSHVTVF